MVLMNAVSLALMSSPAEGCHILNGVCHDCTRFAEEQPAAFSY